MYGYAPEVNVIASTLSVRATHNDRRIERSPNDRIRVHSGTSMPTSFSFPVLDERQHFLREPPHSDLAVFLFDLDADGLPSEFLRRYQRST